MTQQTFTHGHALIIGVGDDPKLNCTVNDAKGLSAILRDDRRCAYPAAQVHLLTEGEGLASRAGILAALDQLAITAGPEATVVIYFSGHGYQHAGVYYLIPHGCTSQNFPMAAITGTEFAAKITAIPAARKVILLDCCHAGGIGNVKDLGLTKSPIPQEALDLFRQGNGYVFIASSTEREFSLTGKPYSVFSGVLIEAFCGQGLAKKDGYVRVADLAGHTRERVPQLTDNKQHPTLHFAQADNFVIAYYAGGEGEPKALPFELQAEGRGVDPLSQKIKSIEDLFVRARYDDAYAQFHRLCDNYPYFQTKASMLLTRYRDFQNQVILGIIPFSQQNTVNLEVAAAFQTCLRQFKQEYLSNKCD